MQRAVLVCVPLCACEVADSPAVRGTYKSPLTIACTTYCTAHVSRPFRMLKEDGTAGGIFAENGNSCCPFGIIPLNAAIFTSTEMMLLQDGVTSVSRSGKNQMQHCDTERTADSPCTLLPWVQRGALTDFGHPYLVSFAKCVDLCVDLFEPEPDLRTSVYSTTVFSSPLILRPTLLQLYPPGFRMSFSMMTLFH